MDADAAAKELSPAEADGVSNGLSPEKVGMGDDVEMGLIDEVTPGTLSNPGMLTWFGYSR